MSGSRRAPPALLLAGVTRPGQHLSAGDSALGARQEARRPEAAVTIDRGCSRESMVPVPPLAHHGTRPAMQDLLDMLPDTEHAPKARPFRPIDRPLCPYEGRDAPCRLSAVLDELTLTYSIVERAADGETRLLRRHVPSLREARRWVAAHRERQRFAPLGRARTRRSRDTRIQTRHTGLTRPVGGDRGMKPHTQARTHGPAPVEARARRFSEGIERMPLAPSSSRVGCFGDGAEGPRSESAKRTGSFADGLAHQPNAASAARSATSVTASRGSTAMRRTNGGTSRAASRLSSRPSPRRTSDADMGVQPCCAAMGGTAHGNARAVGGSWYQPAAVAGGTLRTTRGARRCRGLGCRGPRDRDGAR